MSSLHQKKLHIFTTYISDFFNSFQYEINDKNTRLVMCHMLKNQFDIIFDDYWVRSTKIHSSSIKFVDLTTIDMVNGSKGGLSTYLIGVSISGRGPILFSEFLEMLELIHVRENKINDILYNI